MSSLPENDPHAPQTEACADLTAENQTSAAASNAPAGLNAQSLNAPDLAAHNLDAHDLDAHDLSAQVVVREPAEPLLFQSWEHLKPPQTRLPHFGHLAMLLLFALAGLLPSMLVLELALHMHLFGVSTLQQATSNIYYNLASEGILYLVMVVAAYFFFPLLWGRKFFDGIEWNGAKAARIFFRLFLVAMGCFLFAVLNSLWLPGPKNAPIDKIFNSTGAAWLLFAFGTTVAPFCEELVFRGFLLPSLCTAYDWTLEKIRKTPAPDLTTDGHPQWSTAAMVVGSLLTSLPFAAMHAAQTAYAIGPFLLLICVSLALCTTRLLTRSLASSIVVHACYNFLLFSMMLLGTAGFQHLDKL